MSIKALVNANSIYTVLFPADTKGGLDAANINKKAESAKLSADFFYSTVKKDLLEEAAELLLWHIMRIFAKRNIQSMVIWRKNTIFAVD